MSKIKDVSNIEEKLKVLGNKDRLDIFLMIANYQKKNKKIIARDIAEKFDWIQRPNITLHLQSLEGVDLIKYEKVERNKDDGREKPITIANENSMQIVEFLESKQKIERGLNDEK